jgi:hypothetical protein
MVRTMNMTKKIGLIISVSLVAGLLLLMTSSVMADQNENVAKKWVARYDYTDPSLGDVEYAFNIATDIVVDNDGNVLMTGYEDFWDEDVDGKRQRWVTVKYDSKGRELWVQKYEDPRSSWSQAWYMNSDGSGGVYVTDYEHIIRYASDGTIVWEKEISDIDIKKMTGIIGYGAYPETDSDGNYIFALSVATDWVTYWWDPDTLIPGVYDIHVVKFDKADGEATLLADYSGPGKLDDEALALFIDGDDNIYVTGYTTRVETGRGLLVLKYDSDGDLVWKAIYHNEDLVGNDKGHFIAADSEGDVYITGVTNFFSFWDQVGVTLKYSSEGELLWDSTYRPPDTTRFQSTHLALDSEGDVYIGGYAGWGLFVDLVKYDSDSGEELWVKRYSSPTLDFPPTWKGITVDKFDDVYLITGLNDRIYVEKLDSNGNGLWEVEYDHPDSPIDIPQALTMDDDGNVYVCGHENRLNPDMPHWGPVPDVAVVVKYKQTEYMPEGRD